MNLHAHWQASYASLQQPQRSMYVLLMVVCAWLFVILKLNGVSVDNTLWAEDGKIFIQEANRLAGTSIWTPYAGYLHVYPRLIAWASTYFDARLTPLIFFTGWLSAFTWFACIVGRKLYPLGATLWSGMLTLLLLVAHPHQGEVFFNLTNAQWFMGAGLAVYVLIPEHEPAPLYEKVMLLIAALTGPYALLLLPVLLLQLAIYKDWVHRKNIYVLMTLGAIVQLFVILHSGRISQSDVDHHPAHWLHLLHMFFIFGNKFAISQLAAIGFWWATIQAWRHSKPDLSAAQRHYKNRELSSLILLFAALVFCIGSLVAIKSIPDKVSPMGGGARYFFIPYILILLSTLTLTTHNRKEGYHVRMALILLALLSFSTMHATNLQFKSYAAFAKVKPDVSIPIRPEGQWNIHLQRERSAQQRSKAFVLPIAVRNVQAANDALTIRFNIENLCPTAQHLGFTMDATLASDTYTALAWSESEDVKTENSITRRYAAGNQTIEFALPVANKHLKYLSFHISSPPESDTLHAAKLYCL